MKVNLLPIGSVVRVNDANNKFIIVGFRGINKNNSARIYDYIGYIYPQGFLDRNHTLLFDHKNIEEVFYTGYEDEDEKKFKESLNDIYYSEEGF